MMKYAKFAIVGLLILIAIPFVLANTSEDFESFAIGTPASGLTVPGVTFIGAPFVIEDTAILGFALDGQVLYSPSCGTPLTIQFDAPQTSATVDYALAGNPLRITAYSSGSVVAEEDFNGSPVVGFPQGTASITATFDELIISAPSFSDCLAIDNLNTTALVTESIALDDRINRFDNAAPVAVYANSNGGIDVYTINNGDGAFAFQVDDMSNAECGSTITSQDGIIVSRTSDCVYQVNAPQYNGKVYVLRFPEVSSTTPYTSVEE